ncbi:MAG: hypothetical protein BWZ02_02475 [Lentisphaerae bacterium ADurb.BinA184]|nr:MAG: hypothetical protein BWZ02_02475 [Lentisphaerae bacterium ADurb.BinA184]
MTVRAAWLDEPIIIAGNWEPLIFRRRCGGGPADVAERYAREHTPALADRLKAAGVTLLITHWFKGFGLRAEAEDMAAARRLIGLCHERGIRVGGYVGDTFIFETMLLEEPEAGQWCQRKADGQPVTFGNSQTWRWKWCRNHPAFLPYMRRVLTLGVEAGLDMIHFDNFLNKPEPKNCRCPHCAARFRDFLERKYSPEQRRERLGFADLAKVAPPTFTDQLYVSWASDVIQDPLLQEWVDFRCESLARSYAELAALCRSLKPDMVIECNPTGIWGENAAYMRSVAHLRLLPHGDFFWDESPNAHGLLEEGALSTHLRSMKLGEAAGNRTFFYCWGGDAHSGALHMGEALAANNGCLGMVTFLDGDQIPAAAGCRDFIAFLHEHRALLCGTRSLARVAVYRNFTSLAYNAWEPHVQVLLAEQALLEGNIAFDLIGDLDRAARYDAIVVAGMECLDDAEVAALRALARGGKRVIVIGATGRYDAWRRSRPADPFEADPAILRLPALELPADAPGKPERRVWDDYYRVVDSRFWCRPANAEELLRHVGSPLHVTAPTAVLALPRLAADGSTLVVHFLDYQAARPCPAEVGLEFPGFEVGGPAEWLIPGQPTKRLETFDRLSLSTPYAMLVIRGTRLREAPAGAGGRTGLNDEAAG